MFRDEVLRELDAKTSNPPAREIVPDPATSVIIDRPDPHERRGSISPSNTCCWAG